MRFMPRLKAPAVLAALLFGGCATQPPQTAPLPIWVRQTGRVEVDKQIVFVETDDDADPARARAKAEGMVLENVANECSFIPQSTKLDGRFETQTQHLTQAFARVSVSASECQQARAETSPQAIRRLQSVELTKIARAFRDAYGQPNTDADPSDEEGAYFLSRQRLTLLKQRLAADEPMKKPEAKVAGLQVAVEMKLIVARELDRPSLRHGIQSWARVRHEMMRPKYGADGNPARVKGATGAAAGDGARAK